VAMMERISIAISTLLFPLARERSESIVRIRRGPGSYRPRIPSGRNRELRFSEQHRGDEGDENKYKLNQEKHWNQVMQGAHFILPPFGLGAFNLADC